MGHPGKPVAHHIAPRPAAQQRLPRLFSSRAPDLPAGVFPFKRRHGTLRAQALQRCTRPPPVFQEPLALRTTARDSPLPSFPPATLFAPLTATLLHIASGSFASPFRSLRATCALPLARACVTPAASSRSLTHIPPPSPRRAETKCGCPLAPAAPRLSCSVARPLLRLNTAFLSIVPTAPVLFHLYTRMTDDSSALDSHINHPSTPTPGTLPAASHAPLFSPLPLSRLCFATPKTPFQPTALLLCRQPICLPGVRRKQHGLEPPAARFPAPPPLPLPPLYSE